MIAAAEAEGAGTVLAGREEHRSPRQSGGVDGGLYGAGVEGAAVAPRAMGANASLDRERGGPHGSRGKE